MKKLAVILCLSALSTGAFAQGTINFFNNAATLISSKAGAGNAINTPAGTYYFGLLTNGGSGAFTFTGLYGTNQAAAGRFTGGGGIAAPGWAAGSSRTFEVAGWQASLGPVFNPVWLTTNPQGFGVSGTGSGAPGGVDPVTGGTVPTLNIFGGTTGIQAGFVVPSAVPEPSSMALAGLGAAALLIFRRRK